MARIFLLFLCFSLTGNLYSQKKVLTGKASFYANKFEGRKTASGEIFSQSKLTAAHKTLPFGTIVKVTNLANDKSVVVIINDRGPFVPGRIIDVSRAAAKILGFIDMGVTDVVVEVLEADEDNNPIANAGTKNDAKMPSETAFFLVESEETLPEGFSVQVGSFKESDNLIRFTNRLKKTYGKEVIVEINRFGDVNIYAVLVGDFKRRKRAEKFQKKVDRKHPGSFIVDFSEMEPTD